MVPVLIEPSNDRFQASVLGAPGVRAEGATREDAVAALRAELDARSARGELVWLDPPRLGLSDLAGKYADDPTLEDICAEAYRLRDAEKAAEFPDDGV